MVLIIRDNMIKRIFACLLCVTILLAELLMFRANATDSSIDYLPFMEQSRIERTTKFDFEPICDDEIETAPITGEQFETVFNTQEKDYNIWTEFKEWLGGLGLLSFFYIPYVLFSPIILIVDVVKLIITFGGR